MVRGITFCQSDLKKILKLYLPWNPTEVNREVERIFLAKLRIHIRPHLSQPDIPGFFFFFLSNGATLSRHTSIVLIKTRFYSVSILGWSFSWSSCFVLLWFNYNVESPRWLEGLRALCCGAMPCPCRRWWWWWWYGPDSILGRCKRSTAINVKQQQQQQQRMTFLNNRSHLQWICIDHLVVRCSSAHGPLRAIIGSILSAESH